MRDNHKGMPEIICAFDEEGQYFGVVGIELNDTNKKFRFGVSRAGYSALKRILQLRPFGSMPGVKHRYFFALGYAKIPESLDCMMTVRVEQDRDGRTMDARGPRDLLANLIWFSKIKDFSETAHLPVIE